MVKIESERAWLLKGLSSETPSEIIAITQFYLPDYRLRFEQRNWQPEFPRLFSMRSIDAVFNPLNIHKPDGYGPDKYAWVNCKKSFRAPGVMEEDENVVLKDAHPVPEDMFRANTLVYKFRHIFMDGDLKWEMDQLKSSAIVRLEVELPEGSDMKAPIKMPDHLKRHVVMEITGIKEFSNKSLSVSNPLKKNRNAKLI